MLENSNKGKLTKGALRVLKGTLGDPEEDELSITEGIPNIKQAFIVIMQFKFPQGSLKNAKHQFLDTFPFTTLYLS